MVIPECSNCVSLKTNRTYHPKHRKSKQIIFNFNITNIALPTTKLNWTKDYRTEFSLKIKEINVQNNFVLSHKRYILNANSNLGLGLSKEN